MSVQDAGEMGPRNTEPQCCICDAQVSEIIAQHVAGMGTIEDRFVIASVAEARPSQVHQERPNLRARPVLRSDELAPDHALPVNDVGLGPHLGVIELGNGLRWIADGQEVHMPAHKKLAVFVSILIDADTEDCQTGLVVVKRQQRREFDDTGRAPTRPEVQHHYLTAIAVQMDLR